MHVNFGGRRALRSAKVSLLVFSFALETLAISLIAFLNQGLFGGEYLAAYHIASTMFFLFSLGAWKSTIFRDRSSAFVVVTKGVLLAWPGYTALASAFREPVAVQPLLSGTLLMLSGLLASRWGIRTIVFTVRAKGHLLERAAIVGTRVEVDDLRAKLLKNPMFGYEPIVSLCTDQPKLADGLAQKSSNTESPRVFEDLEFARLRDVTTVFVGASVASDPKELEQLLWFFRGSGLETYLNKPVGYLSSTGFELIPAYNSVLLRMKDSPFRASSAALKRIFDLFFGSALLLVSLPLQVAISVLIVVLDRQAPLFTHTRVGLNGVNFQLLKFRTMRIDSTGNFDSEMHESNRAGNEVQFKLRRDPRVTSLGRWLRRYSLDELPQLLHVLSGRMSLVGPRPHVASEIAKYEDLALNRLRLKPGLTGAWQVSGRSDLSWEESIAIDLDYVQNWSIVLDFVILTRTIWAVIRGKGAY